MGNLKYLDRITPEEIEQAYDFQKNRVKCEVIQTEPLATRLLHVGDVEGEISWVHVVYIVDIRRSDGKTILVDKFGVLGIQRELYPRKKLRKPFCESGSPEIGRVVLNVSFCISSSYRRKGISKTIYELEERLYEKWGADEVQLYAKLDGRVTWRKFGFVLDCMDVGHVDSAYQDWCAEKSIDYRQAGSINDYPKEFLLSDRVKGFKMYKEL